MKGGGAGCVGCVTIRSCPYKVYLRLDSLLVAVPSPDGETEAKEHLRKPDTNRVPQRLFIMFFCEVTRVSEKVIEINNNSELNNNSEFMNESDLRSDVHYLGSSENKA